MILETIPQIQKRLNDLLKATPPFNTITFSPSAVALWNSLFFVIATGIFLLQQLVNIFELEVEEIAAGVPPATPQWVRQKVLEFQYDATDPQIVTLVDFVPTYATVDEDKRIVTRCSVKTDLNRLVTVKVAKSETPEPLATAEANSLIGYLDDILPAGVQRNLVNLQPDRLYLDAEIFYNGQYAATIQDNVKTAVRNYLASIPFDGVVKISKIEDAIQNVAGVTDIVINEVKARAQSQTFANATTLTRNWETVAGYVIEEDESGETFDDTLIFTVANN